MEKEEVNAARVNAIKGLQYLLPVAAAFVCLGGREGSAFGLRYFDTFTWHTYRRRLWFNTSNAVKSSKQPSGVIEQRRQWRDRAACGERLVSGRQLSAAAGCRLQCEVPSARRRKENGG